MKNDVSIQFRMQATTHAKLKHVAQKKLRSVNGQIEYFVLKGIEEFEKENGPIILEDDNKK